MYKYIIHIIYIYIAIYIPTSNYNDLSIESLFLEIQEIILIY